jgi:polyphosphate kinase
MKAGSQSMLRESLDRSAYYINRELSWLAFNGRVLEEAEDARNPLLERVRFLSISAKNLDEFFEIRVADLVQQIDSGERTTGPDGLTPRQVCEAVSRVTHEFVKAQYQCWNRRLRPALARAGIRILAIDELDDEARNFASEYCRSELDLLLTPIRVDPAHPFPPVLNKTLCVGFLMRQRSDAATLHTGLIMVPRPLARLVRLPSKGTVDFILLADLVAHHAKDIYPGYEIVSTSPFRVTRDGNLNVAEEQSVNLLESVQTELHARRKGDAVRLEIHSTADRLLVERLRTTLGLDPWQVFLVNGPALSRLSGLYEQSGHPELKFLPFVPRKFQLGHQSHDLFEELRQHDVLLHHPFDAYETIVEFIESAAEDPRVLSIQQSLYRTSEHPRLVPALKAAAVKKQVTVIVELKARFDEASNIRWAQELEAAGVQVFYGLLGRKIHCKLLLLVRHDPDGVTRQYAHLGTGNYNLTTSKIYTDLSLLTADPEVTAAVHRVFSSLTAVAPRPHYDPLLVAPVDLAERCLAMIDREAAHARDGRPAHIIAKMNGLLDRALIEALYRASQAGTKIDLIVRGMCALRPGVPGLSDNIQVRSIVGRYLEHSRIYYFANGGEEDVYLGSADWMPRNLYERVEVLFPLRDGRLRERIRWEILELYLADNEKSRLLRKDGSYSRVRKAETIPKEPADRATFNVQEFLMGLAGGKTPNRRTLFEAQHGSR